MSDLVTLNVAAKNSKTNRTFSVQVENKNFINSIVTVKNGTITESDVKKYNKQPAEAVTMVFWKIVI